MNPIKWFLRVLRRGLMLGAVVAIVLIDLLILTVGDITVSDKLLIMFICDMLYILIQFLIYYIMWFIIMKED